MASLIYSPAIQVRVETRKGVLDISEDLVSWELNRRENAVSTFNFRLQNTQRKYDGLLLPMDRISVRMKRLAWVQAFTGYLNDGPIFQAWPSTLDITASCSLKRLQYWYWDPGTSTFLNLLNNLLNHGVDANGTQRSNSTLGDRGVAKLITDVVSKVTNKSWPAEKIHIGEIPQNWFQFASAVAEDITRDTAMYQQLGQASLAGSAAGGSASIASGRYGNNTWNTKQVGWASAIYDVVVNQNALPKFMATLALMTAMQESSLRMLASNNVPTSTSLPHDDIQENYGSIGLFQQQTGTRWVPAGYGSGSNQTTIDSPDGWGAPTALMNVADSTNLFLHALEKKLTRTGSGSYDGFPASFATGADRVIQAVQGSATPGAYAKWFDDATAMVKALSSKKVKGGASNEGDPGSKNIAPNTGNPTGSQLAATAINLINAHKPPNGQYITYIFGSTQAQNTRIDLVTEMDCSSLVNWVYYHTTGSPWPGSAANDRGPASGAQYAQCTTHPLLTYDVATKIQGALLFGGANGSEHVGVSLGNGKHIAAHDHYADVSQDVTMASAVPSGNFHPSPVLGGLAPGIDYSAAAADAATAAILKKILNTNTSVAPSLNGVDAPSVSTDPTQGTPTDAFQALLNSLVLGATVDPDANALGGRLALINDQPFLPWIENLFKSSLRSFCSAPNGDLIGWFPDYFGIWGTAGVMNIELIELQDFVVRWSDTDIVTHQFILGNPAGVSVLDQASGNLGMPNLSNGVLTLRALAENTAGVATMEIPEIFEVIYGQKASPSFVQHFMSRFGARPDVQQVPVIYGGGNRAEFFFALYTFMQRWAGQFTADVPVTFMPEIYPGMLIRIPAYGFQAYVTDVTHSGSYGSGGGFRTTISIIAPASTIPTADRGDLLSLLPDVSGKPLQGPIVEGKHGPGQRTPVSA